jgi:hypothetical protein
VPLSSLLFLIAALFRLPIDKTTLDRIPRERPAT